MDFAKVKSALEKRGYTVRCFDTAAAATEYLDNSIDGKLVGFGDSESMIAMDLYAVLSRHNDVYDPKHPREGQDFYATARKCLTTDIFLTSVNGLAETGEMVNIDGTGNRIAGSLFGHEKVYFVIGRNKLVPTLEEACYRARNVAAPRNAARHGYRTPCAIRMDHCYDCRSPQRICSVQTIYWKKMNHMDMEVLLIDEDLGY
ncbi:MAG: LUD-dom domain-containing protein [Succiniclasticum sp.]